MTSPELSKVQKFMAEKAEAEAVLVKAGQAMPVQGPWYNCVVNLGLVVTTTCIWCSTGTFAASTPRLLVDDIDVDPAADPDDGLPVLTRVPALAARLPATAALLLADRAAFPHGCVLQPGPRPAPWYPTRR